MTNFSWIIEDKEYSCSHCVYCTDDGEVIRPECLICRHYFGTHFDGKLSGGRFAPDLYKEKSEEE